MSELQHQPALCIYHDKCMDGYTSAWIVGRTRGEKVELFPASYGDKPPFELAKDRNVYIVDFSYPKNDILALAVYARKIIILDHHKTAKADLEAVIGNPYIPNVAGVFSESSSGAGLCWDWFVGTDKHPWIVAYVQDRDLWKFAYGDDSKAFHAWLSCQRFVPEAWEDIFEQMEDGQTRNEILERGHAILRSNQFIIHDLCQPTNWQTIKLGNIYMPCINIIPQFSSEAGNYIANLSNDNCAALYHDTTDKRRWSLRSNENGPDVSEIAKRYGGGGHRNAAGFSTEHNWFGDEEEIEDVTD